MKPALITESNNEIDVEFMKLVRSEYPNLLAKYICCGPMTREEKKEARALSNNPLWIKFCDEFLEPSEDKE